MRFKKLAAVAMTVLIAATLVTPVLAVEADSAGNIMEADNIVTLDSIPFFGAFLAGQNVSVRSSEADGSVAAAGQEVVVADSYIGESLYVAGNSVTCTGTYVHGNLYGAGNNVSVGNGVEANGVYACGNNVAFAGTAKALCLAGSTVTVSGKVDGDAYIEADKVVVTSDAQISGELKVASANKPEVSDDAKVGSYDYEEISEDEEDAADIAAKVGIGSIILSKVKSCIYWVIAMGVFGMLLVWLFNDHLKKAADLIKSKPGAMIGTGIISWFCIPIAALIMCLTYILAPIAGMLMLAYVLLLCAGLAFAGASLVKLFLPKMNPFLSAFIGIAVLEIVRLIPFIGFIVGMVADMYILAYVIQTIWAKRFKKETVSEAADV